jgi:hypothetical protein
LVRLREGAEWGGGIRDRAVACESGRDIGDCGMGCPRGDAYGSRASQSYKSLNLCLLFPLGRVKVEEAKGEEEGKGLHGLAAPGSYEGDIGSYDEGTDEKSGSQPVELVGPKSRERSATG